MLLPIIELYTTCKKEVSIRGTRGFLEPIVLAASHLMISHSPAETQIKLNSQKLDLRLDYTNRSMVSGWSNCCALNEGRMVVHHTIVRTSDRTSKKRMVGFNGWFITVFHTFGVLSLTSHTARWNWRTVTETQWQWWRRLGLADANPAESLASPGPSFISTQ